jgi:hypothetical protein
LARHRISYALAWRNAGAKRDGTMEFYVPYPGQASAADFRVFFNTERTLFQNDVTPERLYHNN